MDTTRKLALLSFALIAFAGAARVSSAEISDGEQRMVDSINEYRANYGLAPLVVDKILMATARERSPYFSHCPRGMGWSRDHCRRKGFPGPASDNLAQGYPTPESAVEGWASEDRDRSPAGHNYQMRGLFKINGRWLDMRCNRVGAAIHGRNYIAIFGRDESGESRD